MSDAVVTGRPCACSGDRYCAVPSTEPVWVISEAPARAIPKSVTRARPSESTRTFCGFRSRWTMPCSCAYFTPASTWRTISTASGTERPRSIRSLSEAPSTYSIAMKWAPSNVPRSKTPTTFGCWSPEALDELLVLGKARVQELERDPPVEQRVLRAPHVRHSAGAEAPQQPVASGDDGVLRELHQPPFSRLSITCVATGPAA